MGRMGGGGRGDGTRSRGGKDWDEEEQRDTIKGGKGRIKGRQRVGPRRGKIHNFLEDGTG
jgi:hypothetical protein